MTGVSKHMCSAPRIGSLIMISDIREGGKEALSNSYLMTIMIMMLNLYDDHKDVLPIDGVVVHHSDNGGELLVKLGQPVLRDSEVTG